MPAAKKVAGSRNLLEQPAPTLSVEELTALHVRKWQAQGLMPEVEPGKLLVWKRSYRSREIIFHEGTHYGDFPIFKDYYSNDGSELQVNWPYRHENCIVCAAPRPMLGVGLEKGGRHHMLGLLVDKDLLRVCPTMQQLGMLFFAPAGVPVSAYEVWWRGQAQFDFTRIEGVDALDWLPDPLALIHGEHYCNGHGELPPPPGLGKIDALLWPRWVVRPPHADPYLQLWRDRGWLPEVEPGRMLVWKLVTRVGPWRGRPSEYHGSSRYWLGRAYFDPHCQVGACPHSQLGRLCDDYSNEHTAAVIAILADAEHLCATRWSDQEDRLFAMRGAPVAGYEVVRAGESFAYRRLEGEDAFAWLP